MKKFILAALAATTIAAALPTGAMAETTNTVKVTKFHQSYPYSGRATVEYTVGGTLPGGAFAEITITTDDASATFVQSNIVTGANSFMVDFASSFGGALVLTNASFTVTIAEGLGGVKLWANGPYWAECNVGATKPEEYGYYFWWGDTIGYTRSGGTGTWNSGHYCYSNVTWVSSTGRQMVSSPFSLSCPTYNKNNVALQSAGYINYSAGNLVAAHDAATAHLGAPWRLPTDTEFSALIGNCDWTWTTKNGVDGYEVRGRGIYASNSIFLPAAGYGYFSNLECPGSWGYYMSSTPYPSQSYAAWGLRFYSEQFYKIYIYRYYGQSVRPLRRIAE